MQLSDFDFHLPTEQIARYPLEKRSASRLMAIESDTGEIKHGFFSQLIDQVNQGDLLVFNDTKVIPARLFGKKITGGKVEVLVERILDSEHILAQIRASKAPHTGDFLYFDHSIRFRVLEREGIFYKLHLSDHHSILKTIETIGHIPLPSYMHRMPNKSDEARYQTIYAKHKGSIAAPTAGLHFDESIFRGLVDKGVLFGFLTLHIGAGTFTPVRVENIKAHQMHTEWLSVSPDLCKQIVETKKRGKRVIAVGTTSLRALETACLQGELTAYDGETNIFIYPGFQFRIVDALITNLHLPCSTLLMLVCAFGGYETMMHAYRQAVTESYRFYSYGDAMWITKYSGLFHAPGI